MNYIIRMRSAVASALLQIAVLGIATLWIVTTIQGQRIMEFDEATPVTKGNPTEQEKEFTKEFAKRYPDRQRIKLSEFDPKLTNFGIGLAAIGDGVDIPEAREAIADGIFKGLVCGSDIAIVGIPKSKASHLAADETFIYSQYEIKVEEVVFNVKVGSFTKGDMLTIAWPRGRVKLENRFIEAIDFNYSPLKVDSKYLLFLKYVPGAKGYIPVGQESDYEVEGQKLKHNSDSYFGLTGERLESKDFLDRVRNTLTNRCRKN